MRQFIVFILFLIFSISLFAVEEKMKIAILYDKLFTTKKEAKIGAKLWVKQMHKKDERFKLEVVFYDNEKNLIEDYRKKKIAVIASTALLYYNNKKILDKLSEHKWIMSFSKNMFNKYYLIKKRNSKFNLNDLKNKKIYYKDEMSKVWLDSFIFRNKNKSIKKTFIKIEKVKKLIFNIFFNENELSIITKDSYDSMLELNPQISQKVEIIGESESIFFNGIGFIRKDLSVEFENMFELMREKLVKKEKGLEVLSFVDIQKVYVLKESDLDKLDKFYEEYNKLKKLYK